MSIQYWFMRGLCLLAIFGIYLVFQNKIKFLLRSILWPLKKLSGYKKSQASEHIKSILLVISNGKNVSKKVSLFYFITILIFIGMGITLLNAFGMKGLVIASLLAIVPYGYIRARLIIKQFNGSFEGEMLIEELVNQYKLTNRNIFQTIEFCMNFMPEDSLSKKALFQLAIKLNTYGKEEELQEALKNFVLNWNTTWSRMIADNISNAVFEKVDVLHGLENILEECKSISKDVEKNKREGLESEVIVKYICPLFFIILVLMAKNMMGYSWQTIFKYEFVDPRGLMLFTILALVASFNIVIFPILGKQKYDF